MSTRKSDRERAWQSVHVPPVEPASVDLLNQLLTKGIEAVIREADELNVLKPPYGHKVHIPEDAHVAEDPAQNESEDESDLDVSDGEQEEAHEEEPDEQDKFSYAHGFNPVTFLSNFIKKNDPKALAHRAQQKQEALRYLCRRAEAALDSDTAFKDMDGLRENLMSGVILGPSTGDVTSRSARLWAASVRPGKLVFEVFAATSQEHAYDTLVVDTTRTVDGNLYVGGTVVEHLQSSTRYDVRVSLSSPNFGLLGPEGKHMVHATFETLPEEDDYGGDERHSAEEIGFCAFGCPLLLKGDVRQGKLGGPATWSMACEAMQARKPTFLVAAGGIIPSHEARMAARSTAPAGATKQPSALYPVGSPAALHLQSCGDSPQGVRTRLSALYGRQLGDKAPATTHAGVPPQQLQPWQCICPQD